MNFSALYRTRLVYDLLLFQNKDTLLKFLSASNDFHSLVDTIRHSKVATQVSKTINDAHVPRAFQMFNFVLLLFIH